MEISNRYRVDHFPTQDGEIDMVWHRTINGTKYHFTRVRVLPLVYMNTVITVPEDYLLVHRLHKTPEGQSWVRVHNFGYTDI